MIINPFSPVPKNPKSHVRGWALVWSELLGNQPIHEKGRLYPKADTFYLDHGVNFSGGLNLFGGVDEEVFGRLKALVEGATPIVSLDIPMPDYADQLQKRLSQATCHPDLGKILPDLRAMFNCAHSLSMGSIKTTSVAIGDSHSTAFSERGSAVLRTNGATLHGILTNEFKIRSEIAKLRHAPEKLTLVYGSIDIRHHIGRRLDPVQTLKTMVSQYYALVQVLQQDLQCPIEVAAPVPIEWEGRKIPKTGFYHGAPFMGSYEDRRQWTQVFVDELHRWGLTVIQPPQEWYEIDGKAYAETYMELGSSVHIAPVHYRRYSNWEI